MATYLELHDMHSDSDLLSKISTAVTIAAYDASNEADTEPNHTNRLLWAKGALNSPMVTAKSMLPVVLAANKSATITQIKDATDAAIQSNINAAINLFADGV